MRIGKGSDREEKKVKMREEKGKLRERERERERGDRDNSPHLFCSECQNYFPLVPNDVIGSEERDSRS